MEKMVGKKFKNFPAIFHSPCDVCHQNHGEILYYCD